ncbi:MAG: hypothetical protein ACUVXA_04465 [Candidatus Jordarchaeum sp.]|uniref:hypothetical protein n=1 Tax=Candidatus Jordarchaeum sp. TaxID=2823881 RepID=UPI00404B15D9
MTHRTSLTMKLNKLQSIREVIDIIDEIENKPYYASNFFSDPEDSFRYEKPISVENLPFLDDKNISITNFGKMIKKSNNFREIGKFIERINSLSPSTAERLVPILCKKIDESKNLQEMMLCLNQIIGQNFSTRLINSNSLKTIQDYSIIKLAALIVEGLDKKKLIKNLAQSNRFRDYVECLHFLKTSSEIIAEQILESLDENLIIEKLEKTRNPHNIGNLLRILQKINSKKCFLTLKKIIEKLRNSNNLNLIGNCFGGIAIFDTNLAEELLPIIINKMNSSDNLKEVGESFRKIYLANRSIISELFIGLDPDKRNYLKKKYYRYLKS